MKKSGKVLEFISTNSGPLSDALPGMPLVEIIGNNRVLVENHKGVSAYCTDRILIKVAHGQICICGSCMKIAYMSRQRLVITGKVETVSLCNRGL